MSIYGYARISTLDQDFVSAVRANGGTDANQA